MAEMQTPSASGDGHASLALLRAANLALDGWEGYRVRAPRGIARMDATFLG